MSFARSALGKRRSDRRRSPPETLSRARIGTDSGVSPTSDVATPGWLDSFQLGITGRGWTDSCHCQSRSSFREAPGCVASASSGCRVAHIGATSMLLTSGVSGGTPASAAGRSERTPRCSSPARPLRKRRAAQTGDGRLPPCPRRHSACWQSDTISANAERLAKGRTAPGGAEVMSRQPGGVAHLVRSSAVDEQDRVVLRACIGGAPRVSSIPVRLAPTGPSIGRAATHVFGSGRPLLVVRREELGRATGAPPGSCLGLVARKALHVPDARSCRRRGLVRPVEVMRC